MPKPEVIGKPGKISVRISWKTPRGAKESMAFEVYGLDPKIAEAGVRKTLIDLAKTSPAGEGS